MNKMIFSIGVFLILSINSVLANVLVLTSTPNNDIEYKNIFQTAPLGKQLSEIKSLDEIKFNNESEVNSKKDLHTQIENSKVDFVVLIGHNVDGKFYFPSGEYKEISDIDKLVVEKGKYIIYLSCNAQDVTKFPATKHVIDYRSAYELAKKLERSINSYVTPQEEMRKDLVSSLLHTEKPFAEIPPLLISPFPMTNNKNSSLQCKNLFSTKQGTTMKINDPVARISLDKFIKSEIRKEEIKGILTSTPIKMTSLSTGVLIYGIFVDSYD